MMGHANYAPSGSDIVCAALSMASQMLVLGLEEVACAKVEVEEDQTKGFMQIRVLSPLDAEAKTLVETFKLSVKALASQYPENVQVYSC